MASIDGEIPPIAVKNVKMGDFQLYNRRISAYFPQNELYFANKRKISAYFTFAGCVSAIQQTSLTEPFYNEISLKRSSFRKDCLLLISNKV
jgi:hypothetical protein